MTAYSPFQKEFAELCAGDLSALRTVTEGWYVEYKREVPNASSIAKSISAFANTYGGWLFYGVQEKSRAEQVAGAFPGIPQIELDGVLQQLRQAAATLVNPSPHFDVKPLFWAERRT
jgi:predicted HTH transcriptional regulator